MTQQPNPTLNKLNKRRSTMTGQLGLWRRLALRSHRLRGETQAGMTTAEYAVGTLAACAFAAVLLAVVRSGAIKSALTDLIASALSIAS